MTTSVFLNNDRTMPLLGLGLYKTTDAVEAEDAIAAAVQNGYRLLDTASAYKNEEFVGRGIAKLLQFQGDDDERQKYVR